MHAPVDSVKFPCLCRPPIANSVVERYQAPAVMTRNASEGVRSLFCA
jgi:hypothetical protein